MDHIYICTVIILQRFRVPVLAIAMGAVGQLSRVLNQVSIHDILLRWLIHLICYICVSILGHDPRHSFGSFSNGCSRSDDRACLADHATSVGDISLRTDTPLSNSI